MTSTAIHENLPTDKGSNNSDSGANVYDRSNDPFVNENNGTAKFIANANLGGEAVGGAGIPNTLNKFDFHTIKASKTQRIMREGIPYSQLINMLCNLEGELQARDIVIACLRNERVKQLLMHLRTKKPSLNDPSAALFRDKLAIAGNFINKQTSVTVVQAEMEVRAIIEQQMESLYHMVIKQRSTHVRIVNILTESLETNQRMRQELEEEKRKHEHDTAQDKYWIMSLIDKMKSRGV